MSTLNSLVEYLIPEYFNCSYALLLLQLLVLLVLYVCRMLDYLSHLSFFFRRMNRLNYTNDIKMFSKEWRNRIKNETLFTKIRETLLSCDVTG